MLPDECPMTFPSKLHVTDDYSPIIDGHGDDAAPWAGQRLNEPWLPASVRRATQAAETPRRRQMGARAFDFYPILIACQITKSPIAPSSANADGSSERGGVHRACSSVSALRLARNLWNGLPRNVASSGLLRTCSRSALICLLQRAGFTITSTLEEGRHVREPIDAGRPEGEGQPFHLLKDRAVPRLQARARELGRLSIGEVGKRHMRGVTV